MARDRAGHDSRYYCDDYSDAHDDEPERERERRHRRKHRHRDHDDQDNSAAAKRERRERRRADEARRTAEVDIDELRARRASYYSTERHRDSQRMAQDIRLEKDKPRSRQREARRDGTVRRKKRRERVDDDRSDDYVYGRPAHRPVPAMVDDEEVTVRRSSARSGYAPPLGSRPASSRKVDVPKLGRSISVREPQRVYMTRPSLRRTSTTKLPTATTPLSRTHTVPARESARRSSGILATLFRPPPRTPTALQQKEVIRYVRHLTIA